MPFFAYLLHKCNILNRLKDVINPPVFHSSRHMKKAAKNTRKNLSEPRHPLDNKFPFVKTEQIFVSSSRYLRLKFGRLDEQIIHSNEATTFLFGIAYTSFPMFGPLLFRTMLHLSSRFAPLLHILPKF